jgi:hypothetical protein
MCVFSDKCKYCTNLKLIYLNTYAEYSLRESVSAQGLEGRGFDFDSDPGRKKRLYSIS